VNENQLPSTSIYTLTCK